MIVLPIVGRELRVAARRAITYRIRLWAALAAMLLATWKALSWSWQSASAATQGHSLFYTLSGLAFVYCLFVGARVTADCVSEEKREGTLGLLFLTDLKGWDVVLGKLVASSVNSFYGLLAVLPLLAMPLLLGGVTLQQFGQVVIALLNALFFSLSVGICVSAFSRNERKAMLGTMLAIVSPAAVPLSFVFFAATVLEWVQNASDIAHLVPWLMANPVFAYVISLPLPPPVSGLIPSETFWISVAIVQVMSWGLLLLTALVLPAIWKDRPTLAKIVRPWNVGEHWREWTQGNEAVRQAFRWRLLSRNPYLWLVSRDRLKPAYAWLFLISMVGVWLWGYWQHRDVMFDFYPLVPTVFLVHTFLKLWVASEVSHRLVEDQRNGGLELLLTTPLTMDSILKGQRMALLRQFSWPVLVLCAVELMVFYSSYPLRVILPVLTMLLADLCTLMFVAMRLSLTARGINEVLLKSMFYVLVLPWIIYLVTWPAWVTFWRAFFRGNPDRRFSHKVCFWLAVGLICNLVLVLRWARPHLLASLGRGKWRRLAEATPWLQKWLACGLKPEI